MNSVDTTPVPTKETVAPVRASADWREDFEIELRPSGRIWVGGPQALVAPMCIQWSSGILAVPLWSDPHRETSSVFGLAARPGRRRISLREARALALEGLRRAEERRRQFAEEEARRSLALWGEEDA